MIIIEFVVVTVVTCALGARAWERKRLVSDRSFFAENARKRLDIYSALPMRANAPPILGTIYSIRVERG